MAKVEFAIRHQLTEVILDTIRGAPRGKAGQLDLAFPGSDLKAALSKASPLNPSILRLYVLLGALEMTLERIWLEQGERRKQSGLAARSIRGTDYHICLRSKGTALNTGHSMQDVQWLQSLAVFPQQLDGAELELYRLSNAWFIRYAEYTEAPVRIAVWPIARTLKMPPRYEAAIPTPTGCKQGVFRIISDAALLSWGAVFEKNVLNACKEQRVSILLIPELTTSPNFVERISEILATRFDTECTETWFPWLVIGGSYHEEDDLFHNRCVVLTGDGERHCIARASSRRSDRKDDDWLVLKRHRFKLRRDKKRPSPDDAAFGLDRHSVCLEPRRVGERILVVETPIGRVWVTICLDFLKTAGGQGFRNSPVSRIGSWYRPRHRVPRSSCARRGNWQTLPRRSP